jgi:hypothetical protein
VGVYVTSYYWKVKEQGKKEELVFYREEDQKNNS